MNFDGTFEIADVTTEEAWIGLSDPALIEEALPGCEFLVAVDEGDVDFDELRERAGGEAPSTLPDADPEDVADAVVAADVERSRTVEVTSDRGAVTGFVDRVRAPADLVVLGTGHCRVDQPWRLVFVLCRTAPDVQRGRLRPLV